MVSLQLLLKSSDAMLFRNSNVPIKFQKGPSISLLGNDESIMFVFIVDGVFQFLISVMHLYAENCCIGGENVKRL